MVLPLIIRSTEEALKSVPDSYREASFGLGAGKLRTVVRVVLPPAMPGIVAGIILAVGRIVGETAALIYTAGSATVCRDSPSIPCESDRTLAVHMYASALSEGLYTSEAYRHRRGAACAGAHASTRHPVPMCQTGFRTGETT